MRISIESVELKIKSFQQVEQNAGDNIRDRQYARGEIHLLQLTLGVCEQLEALIEQRYWV